MNIVRWVLLVPASFLAYVASYAIGQIIQRLSISVLGFWDADAIVPKLFVTIFASVIAGNFFVVAASGVAPSHKRESALVLSGVLGTILLVVLLRTPRSELVVTATEVVFSLGGVFAGFDSVRTQHTAGGDATA